MDGVVHHLSSKRSKDGEPTLTTLFGPGIGIGTGIGFMIISILYTFTGKNECEF